jgi:hypothetical protein
VGEFSRLIYWGKLLDVSRICHVMSNITMN